MILFSGVPGQVLAMPDPGLAAVMPAMLVKPKPELTFTDRKSIITRVMLSQQTSFQFLHTFGGDVFIYVFGDRIGQMALSGLSFAASCDDTGKTHGVELMLDYYKANRLSTRRAPVTMLIGQRTTFRAVIADFSADVFDPKTRMFQWNMNLFITPDK